ncbi:unnamed protein product [Symbiodinium sp. CCMP2592]|nr:unnamed protein product [Symbiodinium sp. CCMP2592]
MLPRSRSSSSGSQWGLWQDLALPGHCLPTCAPLVQRGPNSMDRQERRRRRQSKRPCQLNRLYTDIELEPEVVTISPYKEAPADRTTARLSGRATEGVSPATTETSVAVESSRHPSSVYGLPTQPAGGEYWVEPFGPPSAEAQLTPNEVQRLKFIRWKTRHPPPTTVYLRPYLRESAGPSSSHETSFAGLGCAAIMTKATGQPLDANPCPASMKPSNAHEETTTRPRRRAKHASRPAKKQHQGVELCTDGESESSPSTLSSFSDELGEFPSEMTVGSLVLRLVRPLPPPTTLAASSMATGMAPVDATFTASTPATEASGASGSKTEDPLGRTPLPRRRPAQVANEEIAEGITPAGIPYQLPKPVPKKRPAPAGLSSHGPSAPPSPPQTSVSKEPSTLNSDCADPQEVISTTAPETQPPVQDTVVTTVPLPTSTSDERRQTHPLKRTKKTTTSKGDATTRGPTQPPKKKRGPKSKIGPKPRPAQTADVYDPDYKPDPASRPKRRSKWLNIGLDETSVETPKRGTATGDSISASAGSMQTQTSASSVGSYFVSRGLGLSQDAYAELMHFLAEQHPTVRPHVIFLQETHWKTPSDYSTDQWHIVSTPAEPAASGGVAILISVDLCDANSILTASPISGRLLHARVQLGSACQLDLINLYQKVWATSLTKGKDPQTNDSRQLRRTVWRSWRQLLGSLPRRLVPWTGPSHVGEVAAGIGQFSSAVCRSDVDPRAQAFRQDVRNWLAANPCRTISEVNQYLHDVSTRFFPSTKPTAKTGAWQHPTVSLSVRQMWAAYKDWKHPPPGRQRLFSAWRAYSQFKRAHREFRRATRAAKTAQMQALTQSMQEATDKGDVRALFRLAASLAPQKRRPRLQLRGPQGELWTPQQQLDCLRQHYEALYASPDTTDTTISSTGPPLPTTSPTISFPDFTVTDVLEGLLKLPPHKAAPPGKATSSSWVLCARELAPWLHHKISHLDQVPSDWRDAWMSLLPKVTHPMKPKDLRPLGITEISGRVAAGLVQKELRPYLVELLAAEPQFAYAPGRSTDAALSRVFAHCEKVIEMCTPAPYNILDSRFAPAAKPLASGGGLQLSLDLSNAFDVLPWALIDRALRLAKVPTSVRELVICWHKGLTYHLTIQGMKARIPAGRGLRQGCRISPLVWSMATIVLLHDLGDRIGDHHWVRAMITAFADDIHGGELITTTAQLDKLLINLGHLLDVLMDAELNINTLKSAFLLRFTKGFAATWKRRHVRQTKEGLLLTLRTPAGRQFHIPVKDEHNYLGLIISYQQPAASSITHRIQAAWTAYGKSISSRLSLPDSSVQLLANLQQLQCGGAIQQDTVNWHQVSFDRLQHSTAGLPFAGYAKNAFPGGLVSVLTLNKVGALRISCPYRLKLTIHNGKSELVVMQDPELRDEVRHHCPECSQWCSSPAGVMTLPATGNMAATPPPQPEASINAKNQELEMFGHLFNSFSNTATSGQAAQKRPRPEQRDAVMTPSSTEVTNRTDPWTLDTWTDPDSWSMSGWSVPSLTTAESSSTLLMQVARMTLRHEQQLHILQQDTRLFLYLKPNQEYSVLPMMLQLATEWRQTMETTPTKLTMSLREIMIRGLLREWKTRLQAFQKSEETKITGQRLQWLDSLGHWNYMHWCPIKQELVLTERQESRSTEEILTMIQEMEELITGDSIKNFKSMRQLRESYQTDWVQFLVEVQLRGPGDKLWTIFNDLIGSAALHLLAARLRRNRYPYSGLAQSIQAQVW